MDIQIVSIWVTAFATCIIALYTVKAHSLSCQIKKLSERSDLRDKEFKKQLKELYKAIVISNIPCSGASTEDKLKQFVEHFKNRDNYFDKVFEDDKSNP